MKPQHLQTGQSGEDLAVKQFVKLGYKILGKNYRKKWGEIDIIAEKSKVLHFIEVKTVSYETDFDNYLPEENVHKFKRKRLERTINTYFAENYVSCEPLPEFQIDVISIYLNGKTGENRIRILEDIKL